MQYTYYIYIHRFIQPILSYIFLIHLNTCLKNSNWLHIRFYITSYFSSPVTPDAPDAELKEVRSQGVGASEERMDWIILYIFHVLGWVDFFKVYFPTNLNDILFCVLVYILMLCCMFTGSHGDVFQSCDFSSLRTPSWALLIIGNIEYFVLNCSLLWWLSHFWLLEHKASSGSLHVHDGASWLCGAEGVAMYCRQWFCSKHRISAGSEKV